MMTTRFGRSLSGPISKIPIFLTQCVRRPGRLSLLVSASAAALVVAVALSGCEQVATYTQPSLVRVIDASYIAPAANVSVEGQLLAGNIGQGTITAYGTLPATNYAAIKITASTGGATLGSTTGTLPTGGQSSILLEDNGAAPNGYQVTILQDQQVAAAQGHSAFRFLNQAPRTGAVDVYMVPNGATLANTIPIVTNLAVGSTTGYISFTSQSVTMVVTPTGLTTPKYTSNAISLVGGEVRTVLIVDTQLTVDPPVGVFMANDVGLSY